MQKTKIDVQEVVSTIDKAIDKLEKGIPNANLTKEEAKDISVQLEEVIALAESMKSENAKDNAQRA
ncbi:MAG: hypothetical protein AAF960_13120 [Bacteroidota bacterium]